MSERVHVRTACNHRESHRKKQSTDRTTQTIAPEQQRRRWPHEARTTARATKTTDLRRRTSRRMQAACAIRAVETISRTRRTNDPLRSQTHANVAQGNGATKRGATTSTNATKRMHSQQRRQLRSASRAPTQRDSSGARDDDFRCARETAHDHPRAPPNSP